MQAARIAELLEPFLSSRSSEPEIAGEVPEILSPGQLKDISTYIDILMRWNARINLTAVRSEDEIVTRHFGESLFAACHLFPRNDAERGVTLADIGSGAGFPGIPIKLWAPQVHVTLVESNHKKATFLREVIRALALADIDIQNERVEALEDCAYDTVTLRAVERFDSILPRAAGLVRPTGRLALMISSAQLPQAKSILSNFRWSEASPIPNARTRIVVVGGQSVLPTEQAGP
jgi:16S rRNA (guanine527-N7)-methyltransferase